MSGTFATRNEALQSCLKDVSVLKNKSPSLVFVFTDRIKRSSKPVADKARPDSASKARFSTSRPMQASEPSQQARASADAWEELFLQDGDYVTLILGRFFNVVKIDATQVDEAQNKYISSDKAPMVILTRKNGDIDSVYDGKARIKGAIIAKAMSDVLRKDGIVTGIGSVPELNALMNQLEKVELALIYANENAGKVKSRNTQKEKTISKSKPANESASSPPESATRKAIEGAEAIVTAKTREKNDILGKEYAMLKELGLPESKLPKDPLSGGTPTSPGSRTKTGKQTD